MASKPLNITIEEGIYQFLERVTIRSPVLFSPMFDLYHHASASLKEEKLAICHLHFGN